MSVHVHVNRLYAVNEGVQTARLFADGLSGPLLLYLANKDVFTFAPCSQWSLWVTLTNNTGSQSEISGPGGDEA